MRRAISETRRSIRGIDHGLRLRGGHGLPHRLRLGLGGNERLDRQLLRLRRGPLAVGQLAQLAVELSDLLEVLLDRPDPVRRLRVDLVGLFQGGRGELEKPRATFLSFLACSTILRISPRTTLFVDRAR